MVDVLAVDDAVIRSTGSTGFGITRSGFVAKPYARLLAEKLATARALMGDDLDLTSGSVIRKVLEVAALEDARTWAALGSWYDNSFVVSASGAALDGLGEELGLARPHERATGRITVTLDAQLPPDVEALTLPRGARLLSDGGDHAALDAPVTLSASSPERIVAVSAFHPGPDGNLDPDHTDPDGATPQRLVRFHPDDPSLTRLREVEATVGGPVVAVAHDDALVGGELRWPDARYRELMLRAPRSLWRADAIEFAVSLVPGVRQALVRDVRGGLDLVAAGSDGSGFVERLFGSEGNVASPVSFVVLIAPTRSAIWDGPDGVRAAAEAEIEDLRPISIYPRIERADEVGVGVSAQVQVEGLPLPEGSASAVTDSPVATALKQRLLARVRRYVEGLRFGDPVRWAEVMYEFMDEPGVADVAELRLVRYPPGLDDLDLAAPPDPIEPEILDVGENVVLTESQVAALVGNDARLVVA